MRLVILESIGKKLILIVVVVGIWLFSVGSVLVNHCIEVDLIDGFRLLDEVSSSGCSFPAIGLCMALLSAIPTLHVPLSWSTWRTLSLSCIT